MRVCLEEGAIASYRDHISTASDLITQQSETRAGFVALALERNVRATPFVEEARALLAIARTCSDSAELLSLESIYPSLIAAAGISDKSANHLTADSKRDAINGLIKEFLAPAGSSFPEELVYRFLLTRGDSLGGSMRNVAGALGQQKFTRSIIAALTIQGKSFKVRSGKRASWQVADKSEPEIERAATGLSWVTNGKHRTLIYNLNVALVGTNIDLCLFNCPPESWEGLRSQPSSYIALGELKGGIDPAGADEHWKTARAALNRIGAEICGLCVQSGHFLHWRRYRGQDG